MGWWEFLFITKSHRIKKMQKSSLVTFRRKKMNFGINQEFHVFVGNLGQVLQTEVTSVSSTVKWIEK